MIIEDTCCTIAPYFKIKQGEMSTFKDLAERFVERTRGESKCLYYGFSFDGDQAHCREGYANAEGVLEHLDNVSDLLEESLKLAEITRLEIHGSERELAKLREPLAELKPQFFVLENGFRK